MKSPEIRSDRDVILTINKQEFEIKKDEVFLVLEDRIVFKGRKMRGKLTGLGEIIKEARELVAQEWSVRDAVYHCAVNGESDAAAMKLLQDCGLKFGVMPLQSVLAVFDKALIECRLEKE